MKMIGLGSLFASFVHYRGLLVTIFQDILDNLNVDVDIDCSIYVKEMVR